MESIKNKNIFGNISIENFLENYWHKKPLLIKAFHPTPSKLASIENLIEMSKDEHFESRIIYPPHAKTNWKAKEGPLCDEDFDHKEFTLAVHGLDLYFEEFNDIKNLFDFIPNWQFDDIMATYSLPGQGVGAHIDNYDVFIFQGEGKRKWSLDTRPNPEFIADIDVKILKQFNPDIEWIIEPGDMVYLPPKVAHHGVTLQTSVSYSIGFKAEDTEKVLNSYVMEFLSEFTSSDFISHNEQAICEDAYHITHEHMATMKKHMIDNFFDNKRFKKWTQTYLSRPRNTIPEGETIDLFSEIESRVQDGEELFFDPSIKFNFTKDEDHISLCISSLLFDLSIQDFKILKPILCTPSFVAIDISQLQSNKEVQSIILKLISFGILYFN